MAGWVRSVNTRAEMSRGFHTRLFWAARARAGEGSAVSGGAGWGKELFSSVTVAYPRLLCSLARRY